MGHHKAAQQACNCSTPKTNPTTETAVRDSGWSRVRARATALWLAPQLLYRIVLAVSVFAGMFWLQSYVIDKYFATESAAVARSTAVMGSTAYPADRRHDIAVLEVNDDYLDFMGETWPPSYALYQAIFEDVAQYQPQSIFLDITLVHSRSETGLQGLIDSLCRVGQSGIRIYLAALENPQGHLYLRPELEQLAGQGRCFQMVGVRYDPDGQTHLVTTYPLLGNGTGSEQNDRDVRIARSQIRSAAYQMARDVWAQDGTLQSKQLPEQAMTQQALPAHTLSLTWGMAPHAERFGMQPWREGCNLQPRTWKELIPAPLRNVFFDTTPPCPYHPLVPLALIADPHSDAQRQELDVALRGKHLMVGAKVKGVQDVVNSPIHGYIPGVNLHAMALDNLLTLDAIKQTESSPTRIPWVLLLLAGGLGLVCFVIYELVQAVFGLGKSCPCAEAPVGGGVGQRTKHELKKFGCWVGAKSLEILISLGLTWLVFQWVLQHTDYSIQALAQLLAVVFALQWTGITGKVFDSLHHVFLSQQSAQQGASHHES